MPDFPKERFFKDIFVGINETPMLHRRSDGALSAALLEWKDIQESFKEKESWPREGSPSRLRSLCLPGFRGRHSPTALSTCGCERLVW